MNVLVISENYLEGGLEKHIAEFASQSVKRNDRLFFAFAHYSESLPALIKDNFICKLECPLSETPASIYHDVHTLVEAIASYHIDIIQVHPFRTYLAAAIAGQLTKTPLVFTFHGPLSYTFPSNLAQATLFQHFLASCASSTLVVNRKYINALQNYFPDTHTVYLPNPISIGGKRSNNYEKGHWCLTSRLDADKLDGLKRFFEWLPELPISILDVYGTGECEDELKSLVSKKSNYPQINWKGYSANWLAESAQCEGIVGLGRIVLEGAIAGFPIILLTYSANPCGLLTKERYIENSLCNFNGSALRPLETSSELAKEMESIDNTSALIEEIQRQTESDYSIDRTYDIYADVLSRAKFRPCPELLSFFDALYPYKDEENPAPFLLSDIASSTMARHFTNPLVFNTHLQSYTAANENRRYIALKDELAKSQESLSSTLAAAERRILLHQHELSNAQYHAKGEIIALSKRVDDLYELNQELASKLRSLEKVIDRKNQQIQALHSSNSWRIGRFFTFIPRKLKKVSSKLLP